MYAHGVGGAIVAEEYHMIERIAGHDGDDLISFADPRSFYRGQPADTFDPAVARQHHVGVFLDDVGFGIEFGRLFAGADLGAAATAVFLADLGEFLFHHAPELARRTQNRFNL